MYSNKDSFEWLVAALSFVEEGVGYDDSIKRLGETASWEINTAYTIHDLSKEIGDYGISLFGECPKHTISTRVKNASELLALGMDCETNNRDYDLLAEAYKAILNRNLGNIYSRADRKKDVDFSSALQIVNATETILSLANEKSFLNEGLKKKLMKTVPKKDVRGLREYLINEPYTIEAFHANQMQYNTESPLSKPVS